jgi:hypothetical protein
MSITMRPTAAVTSMLNIWDQEQLKEKYRRNKRGCERQLVWNVGYLLHACSTQYYTQDASNTSSYERNHAVF